MYTSCMLGSKRKAEIQIQWCKTKVLEINMLLKELDNGKHSQGDKTVTFAKVGCTDSLEVELENKPVVCCFMERCLE